MQILLQLQLAKHFILTRILRGWNTERSL